MSRHELTALDAYPGTKVALGWDPPLRTYFAIVRLVDDDDEPFMWLGAAPCEISAPHIVVDAVRPYAEIPAALLDALEADQLHDR